MLEAVSGGKEHEDLTIVRGSGMGGGFATPGDQILGGGLTDFFSTKHAKIRENFVKLEEKLIFCRNFGKIWYKKSENRDPLTDFRENFHTP